MVKAIIRRAFTDRFTRQYYRLDEVHEFEEDRFYELSIKGYIERVPEEPQPEDSQEPDAITEKREKVKKKSAPEKAHINKPPAKKRIKKPGS